VVNKFGLGAIFGALILQGCAASDTFSKVNTSSKTAERAAEECWRQAEKKAVPSDKANENIVVAYIVGGAVGMGVNYLANEDAYRGKIRDQCMAKRGYSRAKSG
jgi:hypothetical protein